MQKKAQIVLPAIFLSLRKLTKFGKLLPSLLILAFATLSLSLTASAAVETTLKDSEDMTAWLRTPTLAPVAGKIYWLVVSVHGVRANGKSAMDWVPMSGDGDDVIVLGPTFGSPKEKGPAGRGGSYQMSGPAHEAKLMALIAELGKKWKLQPKIILNGFSAGAQFVHRFTFHHPELVAGVVAHSAGSWAKMDGEDRINPVARRVPFAISCGEDDKGNGSADPKALTRIDGARQFAANLALSGFDVDLRTWPGVQHEVSPGARLQTRALIDRIRATAVNANTHVTTSNP